MSRDRLSELLLAEARIEPVAAPAFVLCPIALQPVGGTCPWEAIYRRAYEQAQAVVRPSILQRLSASLAN